jgi:hypothetical protein
MSAEEDPHDGAFDDSMSDSAREVDAQAPASGRKRQFRFTKDTEMTLLRAVRAFTPWEAPHGKTLSAWDEIASSVQNEGLRIDGRRARAKFETLIQCWRRTAAREERQSGVQVETAEREALLEEIRCAIDEWKIIGAEASAAIQKAKLKSEAEGKTLREASLHGLKKKSKDEYDEDVDADDRQLPGRKKRSTPPSQFEEAFGSMSTSYLNRAENDKTLREKEISLQERKLSLEEKRFEIEMQEREASRVSQEAIMRAMLSLVSKLTGSSNEKPR